MVDLIALGQKQQADDEKKRRQVSKDVEEENIDVLGFVISPAVAMQGIIRRLPARNWWRFQPGGSADHGLFSPSQRC